MIGKDVIRRKFRLFSLLGVVVAAFALTACQASGGGTTEELRDFAFAPNQLTAKAGEPVTLSLKNTGTQPHDLSLADLGVRSPVVAAGQTVAFTFTPPRAGTFQFTCDQLGHKEAGMVGTLTVS